MSIKSLCEALNKEAVRPDRNWPDDVSEAVTALIVRINTHRPTGPDGKHSNRHTATCGCQAIVDEIQHAYLSKE